MFSVLFEVHPKPDQWDAYLNYAEMLRPELEQVEGFVDNIRYKSLTREGWILSLSNWRDEKSLVRWRTKMRHHEVQQRGRRDVMSDYQLRVGQVTQDTRIPEGYTLQEQRLDETEVGKGTTVTLVDAKRPSEWKQTNNPADCAERLGLAPFTGFVSWDIFDAVLTPGDMILICLRGGITQWRRGLNVLPGSLKMRVSVAFVSYATTVCTTAARLLNIIRTQRMVEPS